MMSYDRFSCIRPRSALKALSVLVLSCGLSACDPPWSAKQSEKSDASMASAGAKSSPQASSRALLSSISPSIAAAKEEAPREINENQPIASKVELTPREQEGNPDGNAELAVIYENAETLGDTVGFVIDKREYSLKRDPKDPKKFVSLIDFDFDLFEEEQENRRQQIAKAKATKFPVFKGRELVAENEFEFIDAQFLKEAREKSLSISIHQSLIAMPPPPGLDPGNTLLITDLSVVQDKERTFDICGNVGDPNGAWTFKTLMTNMANQPVTGVNPADFVEKWLSSWNQMHTINSFPVPERTKIKSLVIDPWPRDAEGRLDLDQSPMRLLAIVNRMDLRSTLAGPPGYGGANGIPIDGGEGRFVFGVVDRKKDGGCSKMEFTVILEYGIPIHQCTAIRHFADEWIALGGIALGSPSFNPALQAITDQFTLAGAGGEKKPNGSAINQIRTNEIALTDGYQGSLVRDSASVLSRQAAEGRGKGLWELREFHLKGDNLLHIVSTKDTPYHTFNNTAFLGDHINAMTNALLNGTYSVPVFWQGKPFLTGSTFNFSTDDHAVWAAPGIVDPEARHKFSLGTCNACHGGETRYNGNPLVTFPSGSTPETDFVHITPRDINIESHLSKFLTGTGTLSSPSTFKKADPIINAPERLFGDLLRRQTDLSSLSVQSCKSTAILQEALFQSLREVH